jgi:hypothetical protein
MGIRREKSSAMKFWSDPDHSTIGLISVDSPTFSFSPAKNSKVDIVAYELSWPTNPENGQPDLVCFLVGRYHTLRIRGTNVCLGLGGA